MQRFKILIAPHVLNNITRITILIQLCNKLQKIFLTSPSSSSSLTECRDMKGKEDNLFSLSLFVCNKKGKLCKGKVCPFSHLFIDKILTFSFTFFSTSPKEPKERKWLVPFITWSYQRLDLSIHNKNKHGKRNEKVLRQVYYQFVHIIVPLHIKQLIKLNDRKTHTTFKEGTFSGIDNISFSFQTGLRLFLMTRVLTDCNQKKFRAGFSMRILMPCVTHRWQEREESSK